MRENVGDERWSIAVFCITKIKGCKTLRENVGDERLGDDSLVAQRLKRCKTLRENVGDERLPLRRQWQAWQDVQDLERERG